VPFEVLRVYPKTAPSELVCVSTNFYQLWLTQICFVWRRSKTQRQSQQFMCALGRLHTKRQPTRNPLLAARRRKSRRPSEGIGPLYHLPALVVKDAPTVKPAPPQTISASPPISDTARFRSQIASTYRQWAELQIDVTSLSLSDQAEYPEIMDSLRKTRVSLER
jgi:hypothetical protein